MQHCAQMLKGEEVAFGADLWALGCLVYQMLAGTPPFRAASEYLTFQRINDLDLTFPEEFPPDARALVEQLLVSDPQLRFGASLLVLHSECVSCS